MGSYEDFLLRSDFGLVLLRDTDEKQIDIPFNLAAYENICFPIGGTEHVLNKRELPAKSEHSRLVYATSIP